MIGKSDDEANFQYKLLSTNIQVANLHKAFANNSSANVKLSKTQLSKIVKQGGFLGILLCPLPTRGLQLMKNVRHQLAKGVLIPLGLIAEVVG